MFDKSIFENRFYFLGKNKMWFFFVYCRLKIAKYFFLYLVKDEHFFSYLSNSFFSRYVIRRIKDLQNLFKHIFSNFLKFKTVRIIFTYYFYPFKKKLAFNVYLTLKMDEWSILTPHNYISGAVVLQCFFVCQHENKNIIQIFLF